MYQIVFIIIRISPFILIALTNGCSIKQSNIINTNIYALENNEDCAIQKDKLKITKDYILAIGKRGKYNPLTLSLEECPNGDVKQPASFDLHLKAMIERIRKKNEFNRDDDFDCKNKTTNHLFIFIHGGLNNYEDSVGRSVRDIQEILKFTPPKSLDDKNRFDALRDPSIAVGAARGRLDQCERYIPLFIVWPSDGVDTYIDDAYHYEQGEYDTNYQKYAGSLEIFSDFGETIARAPQGYSHTIRRFNKYKGSEYLNDIANKAGCENGSYRGLGSIICSREGTLPKNFNETLAYSLLTPVRLFTVPLTDTLGNRAWRSMLARTRFAFRRPISKKEHLDDLKNEVHESVLRKKNSGALRLLLEYIKKEFKLPADTDKKNKPIMPPITLVGHSMGTIITNQIIAEYPDFTYKNIVYMAAASSIRNFRQSVEPILHRARKENDYDVQFFNLSLHPKSEAFEINLMGAVPSGSLLEWIDNFYSSPATHSDATLGKWENVFYSIYDFNKNARDSMHFKRFGLSCASPQKHGEFLDPPETKIGKKECICTETECMGGFIDKDGVKHTGWLYIWRYWDPRFWAQRNGLCECDPKEKDNLCKNSNRNNCWDPY